MREGYQGLWREIAGTHFRKDFNVLNRRGSRIGFERERPEREALTRPDGNISYEEK